MFALYISVRGGNLKEIKENLRCGIDINHQREDGGTILHLAATSINVDVVRYLVEAGADFNAKNKRKETPLVVAICHKHLDIARYLVDIGADVNVRDEDWTLMSKAIEKLLGERSTDEILYENHKEFIRYLVKAGIDLNAQNGSNYTPLKSAIFHSDDSEIHSFLLEKSGDTHPLVEPGGNSVVSLATYWGRTEIFFKVIEKGVDIHQENMDMLFQNAVKCKSPKILSYFLRYGFDVNVRTGCGYTPLMQAAIGDDTPVENLRLLVNAGAKVNERDHYGFTPLAYALISRKQCCVEFLVEAGGEVDITKMDFFNIMKHIWHDRRNYNKLDNSILVFKQSNEKDLEDLVKLMQKDVAKYLRVTSLLYHYLLLLNPKIKYCPKYLVDVWGKYQREALQLESCQLGRSRITLHNYMVEPDVNLRTGFLSNNTTGIREELEAERYKEKVGSFTKMIKDRLSEDIKRAKLLHVITRLKFFESFTITVRLMIAGNLANSNLECLVK